MYTHKQPHTQTQTHRCTHLHAHKQPHTRTHAQAQTHRCSHTHTCNSLHTLNREVSRGEKPAIITTCKTGRKFSPANCNCSVFFLFFFHFTANNGFQLPSLPCPPSGPLPSGCERGAVRQKEHRSSPPQEQYRPGETHLSSGYTWLAAAGALPYARERESCAVRPLNRRK